MSTKEPRTLDQVDISATALAEQIERLGAQIDISMPSDIEEAWERAVEESNRAARAIVREGVYLLWLRSQLPHGEFLAGVEAWDFAPRQAQYAMRVAELLLRASNAGTPPHLKKLLGLSRSRLIELARFDSEEFEEIQENNELDLDDVAVMPVRQLRKEVRRLRLKRDDLGIRLDLQRAQIQRLQSDVGVIAGREFPASVVRTREEVAVFAEQAKLQIAAIVQQARRFLLSADLGQTRLERGRNIEEAAKPIALHIAAVIAAALDAQVEIQHQLADWLPSADWGAENQPSPLAIEQVRELAQWRDVHVRYMDAGADRREADRVERGAVKRGRGRPAKRRMVAPRRSGKPRKQEVRHDR